MWHLGPAHLDAAVIVAGVETVFIWKGSALLDGMPTDMASGLPYRAPPASLLPPESITVQCPPVGGLVKYSEVQVKLPSAGPDDLRGDDDPTRIFGRYDGGGWSGRLLETLQADTGLGGYIKVSADLSGPFPRLVHLSQEAIAVSASVAQGGGVYHLTILERGAADTAVQEHEYDPEDEVYVTIAPTVWHNRPVSLWVQRTDPAGNRIGTALELFIGEIEARENRVTVRADGVTFVAKPLTGTLQRALGRSEPEVIELARGVHRYDRTARCQVQIGQDMGESDAAPPDPPFRKLITGSVFVTADPPDRFITLGWPSQTMARINGNLEADRGDPADAPHYDQQPDNAVVRIIISPGRLAAEVRAASIRDVTWLEVASAITGEWDEGAPQNDLNMYMGVDLLPASHTSDRRTIDGMSLDVAWRWRERGLVNGPNGADPMFILQQWPLEAYFHRGEHGILCAQGIGITSSIEMVVEYFDSDGVLRSAPFIATGSTDLGDGTYWLEVDPVSSPPSFGQRNAETRARIYRRSYADRLPFWRFMAEVLNSGTARQALGTYDRHINGAGLPDWRLDFDSFSGLRLPSTFGDVTGSGMFRDPSKLIADTMKLAVAAFGVTPGENGRAQLSVFRRSAARPDLARQTILDKHIGGSAPELKVASEAVNQISIKLADREEPVVLFSRSGRNAANAEVYHLTSNRDPAKADLDLSAVELGTAGDVVAALTPVASRLFARTLHAQRSVTIIPDPRQVDLFTLRPFDTFKLTTGRLQIANGQWGVSELPVQATGWTIPIRGGTPSLTLEVANATATGRNASASITAISGATVTVDTTKYIDARSLVDGSPQDAMVQFDVGEKVYIYLEGDMDSGVERTIDTKDTTAGTFTMTAAIGLALVAPALAVMRPANYSAPMSERHRALAVVGDDSGKVAFGVGSTLIL